MDKNLLKEIENAKKKNNSQKNTLIPEINITFGNNLKELIRQKQREVTTFDKYMTVKGIAKDIGISHQSLLDYKNGRIPRFHILEQIANYFGVSQAELLGEKELKNEFNDVDNFPFSDKAIRQLKSFAKNKNKEEIAIINKMLESPTLLKIIGSIINYKK